MRVYLDQIGCRLNFSEMETLAQRLRNAGHQTVTSPEEAQVVVFNTCAVTAAAASKSRQRIRQLHKLNPSARIAVTGCWSSLEPQAAARLPGVALVADNSRKDLLHTLLEPWSAELDDPADLARMQPDGTPFEEPLGGVAPEQLRRTRAFIKVQDGCNNRCTFCVVTIARGASRSRPVADIVREIQELCAAGVQEAVLTGVHLGSYGRDLAGKARTDLKELTAAILTDTDIPRLRLSSLEPWELAEGFFELWARWPGRLCPHLHLPLQAGTDKLLRRMARRCTTASFRQLVAEARAAIPDLILTTDLIVGFPGETEADFVQGMAFVEEMRFAHAHIFPFSPRAGTAAARFDGQVDGRVKKERSRRLHEVVERTGRAERLRFVGTVRPVLWEGERQSVTDTNAVLWAGYTDNYLRVMALAPADLDLHNTITPVRLDELHGDILLGTIDGLAPATLEGAGLRGGRLDQILGDERRHE
ncbi:tRNA (N(6)-L-threonylcarbamoyladenosine(37)-C(2))-methylthiotransferase MtaB [Litorilinea aerophila]|uniref:tRNA (N(6)-L-threonylcarbamoyladenosine(37)-C(2))-methylthiotransferase MtaB n=1 Tax=Litorilinea aerophila TaxID=1204385 RepID=A0A540VHD1_9CHLR|nr:tRNA (N(6)-L-threonylcarbamoyladenosine(37)-C(2))-methylthiotransferase MtaB [Litorilinea aerophila]MCC9076229.1 tRNA (N(6)-L-threonylcarbamoyladenosine(37)-C(2))-methylthiotransferase MtaB [Litorilinea aerophila]